MGETELKKCPHCGGDACLHSSYSYKSRKYFVFVKCNICGSQGKIIASSDNPAESEWNDVACNDAVSAWNLRCKEGAD